MYLRRYPLNVSVLVQQFCKSRLHLQTPEVITPSKTSLFTVHQTLHFSLLLKCEYFQLAV